MTSGVPTDSQLRASHEPVERPVEASMWSRAYVLSAVVAAIVLLSVFMRTRLPVLVLGSGGDDLLFVREASSLSSGHWLGSLDYLTMSKGPSYPAFIAVTYVLALPLKTGEQLTLLLAAGFLAIGAALVLRRIAIGLAIFAGFAFLPDNFAVMNSWVLRDGWYASLSLLLLSGFFVVAYLTRFRAGWGWPLATASITGLAAAAFWLCREEGIWILPALAVITAWYFTSTIRSIRRRQARGDGGAEEPNGRRPMAIAIIRPLAVLAVLILVTTLPIAAVIVENGRNYGAGLTNDMASGAIPRAYAEWLRVRAGTYSPRVPINREQRAAVYQVSAAARELRVWLDQRPNGWLVNGCAPRPDGKCDYSGSVLIWAVRHAAQSAGHFRTESHAQAFFSVLADQIARACDQNALDCAPELPELLQPVQRIRATAALRELYRASIEVLWSRQFTEGPSTAFQPDQPAWDRTRRVVPDAPASYDQAITDIRAYQRHELPFRIMEWIYRIGFPVVLLVGIIGLILGAVRHRRAHTPLVVLGCALLVAALSRLVLLAVTATSEFGTGPRYQMPTRLMLFGVAAVGLALLIDIVQPRRGSTSRPTDR